jgi:hypothetical protein
MAADASVDVRAFPDPLYVYRVLLPASSVVDDGRYWDVGDVFAYDACPVAPPGACTFVNDSPPFAPYVPVDVPAVEPVPDVADATSASGVYVRERERPSASVTESTKCRLFTVYVVCGAADTGVTDVFGPATRVWVPSPKSNRVTDDPVEPAVVFNCSTVAGSPTLP